MSAILIRIFQVILALSTLILIHEAGHFSFSKLFHIRVDKFFLFFDVGGVKLLSTKSGWFSRLFPRLKGLETEYGLGWLPLGGYCKICGMVDESLDTEALKQEPQPWEMRTKPAWQRFFVMFGGVLFNFILAILLYSFIAGIWGEAYISNENTRLYASELATEMGFRSGDRILRLDDDVPEDFSMIQADIVRNSVSKAVVLRGSDTLDIYIDQSMMGEILNTPGLFGIAVPFIVDTIPPASPNFGCGLLRGDRIVELCGTPVEFVQDSRRILADFRATEVHAKFVRDTDTLSIGLKVDSLGYMGISAQIQGLRTRTYNALTAIPAGFKMTFSTIGGYLKDLRMVATPSTGAYKSVGSFISIGQIFPTAWDWYSFLQILALLSIMLGVMNLIPIPGLDGGHIVFIFYEMLSGRKPSEKFMIGAQFVGMALLVALMVFACGNDISRLIH